MHWWYQKENKHNEKEKCLRKLVDAKKQIFPKQGRRGQWCVQISLTFNLLFFFKRPQPYFCLSASYFYIDLLLLLLSKREVEKGKDKLRGDNKKICICSVEEEVRSYHLGDLRWCDGTCHHFGKQKESESEQEDETQHIKTQLDLILHTIFCVCVHATLTRAGFVHFTLQRSIFLPVCKR